MADDTVFDELDADVYLREIQNRPIVWNPAADGYTDRARKRLAWRQIAAATYKHFDEKNEHEKANICLILSKKWRNIKDNFIKYVKHGKRKRGREYVYARQLRFLKTVIKIVPSNGRLTTSPKAYQVIKSDSQDNSETDPLTDFSQSCELNSSLEDTTTVVPRKAKRIRLPLNKVANGHTTQTTLNPFELYEAIDTEALVEVEEEEEEEGSAEGDDGDEDEELEDVGVKEEQHDGYESLDASETVSIIKPIDPDRAFFESLLPSLADFDEDEKLEFRADVLNILRRMRRSRKV